MSITWKGDLPKNIEHIDKHILMGMAAAANSYAPIVERHMKETATWKDRTGNARNGLSARPEGRGRQVRIVLKHGVPYGIFLELRWSGRYAVIIPTIIAMGSGFMEHANGFIFTSSGIGILGGDDDS